MLLTKHPLDLFPSFFLHHGTVPRLLGLDSHHRPGIQLSQTHHSTLLCSGGEDICTPTTGDYWAPDDKTLTYYAFPSTHWRQIKTNNPLERIIREIRRRTRVVGAFPDGHSALMLAAARLRHIASTKWGKRRYMIMDPLLNPAKQEEAAA